MRIEGYGIPTHPRVNSSAGAPVNGAPRGTQQFSAPVATTETDTLSAQEKLRLLLDEKRHLTEATFDPQLGESMLGQHIDLRV